MKETKYRIMHDYGSDGFVFYKDHNCVPPEPIEYKTISEAVKAAMDAGYTTPWIIVKVIEWEAKEL